MLRVAHPKQYFENHCAVLHVGSCRIEDAEYAVVCIAKCVCKAAELCVVCLRVRSCRIDEAAEHAAAVRADCCVLHIASSTWKLTVPCCVLFSAGLTRLRNARLLCALTAACCTSRAVLGRSLCRAACWFLQD
jgi:hypothetical protein